MGKLVVSACALCFLLVTPRLSSQSLTPAAKANLDLPVSVLSAHEDEDEDAPEMVVFYGQVFESDAFFFVVDWSMSLQQDGLLTIVRRELIRNIQEFSPEAEFGIVFFNLQVDVFPTGKRPVLATALAKRSAINWVRETQPHTHTCIKKGLIAGLDMATRSTKRRRLIIYLGDGDGTCLGPQDRYLKETLAEVTTKNRGRVEIHAIGVAAEEFQADFLRKLTSANGGTFMLKTTF